MNLERRNPNDVEIRETSDGLIVPVQAQPRARRSGVMGVHAGRLKVAVTQVPEKGKANDAIAAVLAAALGLKRSQVLLHGGTASPRKTFLVSGLSAEELERRISDLRFP